MPIIDDKQDLAIFPIAREDMDFLLDLRIDSEVRLWDGHYDSVGFWKSDEPLVSPEIDDIISKMSTRSDEALSILKMSDLRLLATKVGLFWDKVPKQDLVVGLQSIWIDYFSRT